MSISKKLMTTGATEDTYVEDVFSTYLYTGNGAGRTINNGINLGDFGLGTSTEFDGGLQLLDKPGGLSGAVAGKTFTFSAWIKPDQTAVSQDLIDITTSGTQSSFSISFSASIGLEGRNSSGTRRSGFLYSRY